MISQGVLLVVEPFDKLSAQRVAEALERGFRTGDRTHQLDVILVDEPPASAREWWGSDERPKRLRAARAVVIASATLDERTLAGSVMFEIATSARQAGVPAYGVTSRNSLDLFDARMLDLQVILEARDTRALSTAAGKLAELV